MINKIVQTMAEAMAGVRDGAVVLVGGFGMLVLAVGSHLITRTLSTELKRSRWQDLLEIVVTGIEKQIEDVGLRHALDWALARLASRGVYAELYLKHFPIGFY